MQAGKAVVWAGKTVVWARSHGGPGRPSVRGYTEGGAQLDGPGHGDCFGVVTATTPARGLADHRLSPVWASQPPAVSTSGV